MADTTRHEWVLASGNAGKLRELSAILTDARVGDVVLRPQSDFALDSAAETAPTFVENALLKARHAARHTGLPALADDSGLVVPALHGAPGVRSARYAGDSASDSENVARLLRDMDGLAPAARACEFVCVITFIEHAADPLPLIATGRWRGHIATAPRGEAGFGYDPVFQLPHDARTAAELDAAEKNRLSHRGQALSAFVRALRGRRTPV